MWLQIRACDADTACHAAALPPCPASCCTLAYPPHRLVVLCYAVVHSAAAAPAPAAAAPAAGGPPKKQGVKDWSADKVIAVMRMINFFNGVFMIAGAILQIVTGVVSLDFQVLLLSVYITCVPAG